MKQSLKLLHTSDIHLDDRIGAGEETSPAQLGFMSVVDAALRHDVDVFLLAGDLFDHNRVKEPCHAFARSQLARLSCPVVMISGNHDCTSELSVYHQFDPTEAGDHVTFLKHEDGGIHRMEELGLTIWGRGIVDHHPEHRPIETVPDHEHDGWFIGITHGHYVETAPQFSSQQRSSQITAEEIENSNFDYLALGHVHVFRTMQHGRTLAAYSGSPNLGQGSKEMSAALVTLCPESGVSVEKLTLL